VDFPGTVAKPGYMQLYNASARAVKAVDPSLKVGGPATAGLADLPAFVTACAAMGLPRPDFVSSHHCTCLPSPVACINAASVCSSRPGGCICSLFNSLRLLHIIGTGSLRLDIMNVCVCVRARARCVSFAFRSFRRQIWSDSNATSLPIATGLGPFLLEHPSQGGSSSGCSAAVSSDGVQRWLLPGLSPARHIGERDRCRRPDQTQHASIDIILQ
jgi:hypothetical protein